MIPTNWEQAYDKNSGRIYFVDHNNRTTTWLNPLDESTWCEKIDDKTVGTYYANHIDKRNQWTNPVSDWREKKFSIQHHYSNSQHLLSLELSQTDSPNTTDKPDSSSFHTPEHVSKSQTNLENETTNETTGSKNNSIGKYDNGLLDIMENCFGRRSSQSVEV